MWLHYPVQRARGSLGEVSVHLRFGVLSLMDSPSVFMSAFICSFSLSVLVSAGAFTLDDFGDCSTQ